MIPFEVIALSPYAREMLADLASRRGATRFHDATQRVIDLRPWRAEDWSRLVALYDSFFAPGNRTRSFPPLNAQQRASWLEELTSRGPNVVAVAGTRIVGHAALVGYDSGISHELVLFVHPDYRNTGIGGALLDSALDSARREDFSRIWISGEREHGRIASLYESRGFQRGGESVAGREVLTLVLSDPAWQSWRVTERFVAAIGAAAWDRLGALARGLRVVMIPLVCALMIAVASEDPRGRALALVLAAAAVVFGIGIQMKAIIFGTAPRRRVPNEGLRSTAEWMARLR
jgi:GNAT superfamily N-acetyltransferase